MTGPAPAARPDASLSHLPDDVRRAVEITPAAGTRERIVDITTRGRRTGRPRRIEIFFYRAAGRTYLCSGAGGGATGWHANLLADPRFTFHLKNGVRADLPARATHDPGTIRPTRLEDWAHSRLMRVDFPRS
jgi:hypothetical protein